MTLPAGTFSRPFLLGPAGQTKITGMHYPYQQLPSELTVFPGYTELVMVTDL